MPRINHFGIAAVRAMLKTTADFCGVTFDPTCLNKHKTLVRLLDLAPHSIIPPNRPESPSINRHSKLHYLTLIDPESFDRGLANALISTYRRRHIEPTILHEYDSSIRNWSKITAMCRYLQGDDSIGDDDIVVFTDATDVVCFSSPHERVSGALIDYGVEVLFGAENRFAKAHPSIKPFFDEAFAGNALRYLNSGFVCGKKKHLFLVYRYLYSILMRLRWFNVNGSDQAVTAYGVAKLIEKQKIRIGIDYNSSCITTINSSTRLPRAVSSPFVHVTSLRDPVQAQKWIAVRQMASVDPRL